MVKNILRVKKSYMRYPYKLLLALGLFINTSSVYAEDFNPYYVELFSGQAVSIYGGPNSGPDTSGGSFNGRMSDINLHVNTMNGVRIGYRVSNNYRFDISYYKIKSNLDWTTNFPGNHHTEFIADMDSRLILLSAYYDFTTINSFSPYIGVGIGQSRNEFKSGEEFSNGKHLTYLKDKTTIGLSYRLAVGIDYLLSQNLSFTADLSLVNIGDASSGDERTAGNTTHSIGVYKFEDMWIRTISIGLKYHF